MLAHNRLGIFQNKGNRIKKEGTPFCKLSYVLLFKKWYMDKNMGKPNELNFLNSEKIYGLLPLCFYADIYSTFVHFLRYVLK